MLTIHIHNETGTKPDGTSDYSVMIRLNDQVLSRLSIKGHRRGDRAKGTGNGPALLHRIANAWKTQELRRAHEKIVAALDAVDSTGDSNWT